jgi:gas vesicle protein
MKRKMWLGAFAVLLLAVSGCEKKQEEAVQPPPTPQAAVEEPKTVAEEAKEAVEEAKDVAKAVGEKTKEAAKTAVEETKEFTEKVVEETKTAAKTAVEVTKETTKAVVEDVKAAVSTAPKIVTYPASYGQVVFDHQAHAAGFACSSCHTTDPPVKIELDKDQAHSLCKGCHQEKAAGPTQCNGCHKKG